MWKRNKTTTAENSGRILELEQTVKQQQEKLDTLGTIMVDLLHKFNTLGEQTVELRDMTRDILDKLNANVN